MSRHGCFGCWDPSLVSVQNDCFSCGWFVGILYIISEAGVVEASQMPNLLPPALPPVGILYSKRSTPKCLSFGLSILFGNLALLLGTLRGWHSRLRDNGGPAWHTEAIARLAASATAAASSWVVSGDDDLCSDGWWCLTASSWTGMEYLQFCLWGQWCLGLL